MIILNFSNDRRWFGICIDKKNNSGSVRNVKIILLLKIQVEWKIIGKSNWYNIAAVFS